MRGKTSKISGNNQFINRKGLPMNNVYRLVKICAEEFNTDPMKMQGKTRRQNVVFARHTAMSIMRNDLNLSYYEIGFMFNRNHSTVIHAVKSVNTMREVNKGFIRRFDAVYDKYLDDKYEL
jgi:chromosomal replication initiator protein